jgi:hypothetical protein
MTAAPAAGAAAIPGGRRIIIGVALGVVGLGATAWQPLFALLVTAIAVGCLWEFAQLSARKGPAIEFPVALAAVAVMAG